MQGFLLDTCTWIDFFHHQPGIEERLSHLDIDSIFISEISIAELTYGALNSQQREKHIQEVEWLKQYVKILPISDVLNNYAEIRYALKQQGRPVGNFDILIGATVVHHNLILVTNNVKDFEHMPNVKLENWSLS